MDTNTKILITIVAVVAIISITYIIVSQQPTSPTGQAIAEQETTTQEKTPEPAKAPEKENCPFDCCIIGEYKPKQCDEYYECVNSKCKAIDSDKDGLTDVEEIQFGSNLNVYDTDSDGLNDYAEKQKGTNPNNQNTDGDRYNDNLDSEPTIKNTASVDIEITKKDWVWDLLGLLDILEGDLNIRVATAKIDINIVNSGNDYTSYVRFDSVFKIMGNEVKREQESISRLDVGQSKNKHYEYELKLGDVPQTLWEIIQQRTTDWDAEIQNIEYEKFA